METTVTTVRGDITLRPSRREDATNYRDLRLDALQRSPAAFGADYESSAARPLSFWEERMAQGALGEQGVTYLALAGDALIGMTSLVRNTLAKTQHSASIFDVCQPRLARGRRCQCAACRLPGARARPRATGRAAGRGRHQRQRDPALSPPRLLSLRRRARGPVCRRGLPRRAADDVQPPQRSGCCHLTTSMHRLMARHLLRSVLPITDPVSRCSCQRLSRTGPDPCTTAASGASVCRRRRTLQAGAARRARRRAPWW